MPVHLFPAAHHPHAIASKMSCKIGKRGWKKPTQIICQSNRILQAFNIYLFLFWDTRTSTYSTEVEMEERGRVLLTVF